MVVPGEASLYNQLMQIVSGTAVFVAIEQLIANAEQKLVLVTAYLDPWMQLTTAIQRARARGIPVTLLLRGGEDRSKDNAAAFAAREVDVHFLDRLHAKIYLSERQAILTSMNLVAASRDSWEVATVFDAAADAKQYDEIVSATKALFEVIDLAVPSQRLDARTARRKSEQAPATREKEGHCIRCGEHIRLNQDKPMCRPCYEEWAQWEDEDYEESWCHTCGKKSATSMAKPRCRKCWQASLVE